MTQATVTLKQAFSVGAPIKASDLSGPGEGVVQSCLNGESTNPNILNFAVVIPGHEVLTATFSGSIPLPITVTPGVYAKPPPPGGGINTTGAGGAYMEVPAGSGGTACSSSYAENNNGFPSYTMSSGQSVTIDFFILLPGALSESQPNFDPSQRPDLGLGLFGYTASTSTATGPNASSCDINGTPTGVVGVYSAQPVCTTAG